jgi:putative sigma-54 modulation protein
LCVQAGPASCVHPARDSAAPEVQKERPMNLNLTGQHLEITPAIRAYVVTKLERINRHFNHVIDVSVVMSVDKLRQKVEANVHVRGKDMHAESVDADMYAAIDALADKLDRQLLKHKELLKDHRCDSDAIARAAVESGAEGGG